MRKATKVFLTITGSMEVPFSLTGSPLGALNTCDKTRIEKENGDE